MNRLDFLGSLDSLLFGDFKKTLLERKQLHRILTQESWLFGEQYTLGVDDQAMTNVLQKHIQELGRSNMTPESVGVVSDFEDKNRIVDLMLTCQVPQNTPDEFEHLVIELKRPSCKIGQKEIGQIENYAFTVADDERFDKLKTKWNFILVGNDLNQFADRKCRVQ